MSRLTKSIEAEMREHAGEAIETIKDLLDSEDPKVRLAAAREVLDRSYGKPIGVTVMVPGNTQTRQRLAAMSDGDLLDVIEAEFEPLPALPAPISTEDAPAELPELSADPLFN